MATVTHLSSINPATLENVGEVPIHTPADVLAAVQRARLAQPAWAALSVQRRLHTMRRYQTVIVENIDRIVETVWKETSKPRTEVLVEIFAVLEMIRHYRNVAAKALAPRKVSSGIVLHKRAYKRYEPMGVIGVISPWNYPFLLPHTPVLTALIAGNAVVLKPSELTSLTGQLIGQLLKQVLPDPEVFQIVTGTGETGAALVTAGTDKICFTGSVATGKKIMAAAADSLTPVVMELGGKDPMIVCADADLERASAGAVWAAFSNSGQTCMAVERVYVVDSVAEAFTAKVVAKTNALRQGVDSGDIEIGAMISERQRKIVESHVASAIQQGAQVLTGGREGTNGFAYEPTVLSDVTSEMPVMQEETFGPVLPIMRVPDVQTAVRLANETPFGLTASVWTRDTGRGEIIAAQLNAGVVCVNDHLVNYGIPALPFGGIKESGFGRLHGEEGLMEMVRVKSVVVDRLGLSREPYWFPYTRQMTGLLEQAIKFLYR
ncbi:MAG: aldehyde dehydrogenase family protein [Candidatus Sericytochromatia bacterium]|nr:aldehyde dehydrogenase family protein [Candidatus Sericytochromatia bacterium]